MDHKIIISIYITKIYILIGFLNKDCGTSVFGALLGQQQAGA